MATVPDRHPFGITVVGYTGGPVGLGVTRSGEAGVVGLGSEEVTVAGEVQDTAATDSSTQTTASRAPVPPSGPMGAIVDGGDGGPPGVDLRARYDIGQLTPMIPGPTPRRRLTLLPDRPDGRGGHLAQPSAQRGARRAVGLRLHDPQARARQRLA